MGVARGRRTGVGVARGGVGVARGGRTESHGRGSRTGGVGVARGGRGSRTWESHGVGRGWGVQKKNI